MEDEDFEMIKEQTKSDFTLARQFGTSPIALFMPLGIIWNWLRGNIKNDT